MQTLTDKERKEVLGEVLADKLKAIREYVQDVPVIKDAVARLENDMGIVKTDIKAIKVVVQTHSQEIKALQT
ncbi:hypothetical protein HY380_01775 [Candidatus Saccharibacteria bacterium]|nr:hypothetical protein [Candidatus Saccharibacteria bacterium]